MSEANTPPISALPEAATPEGFSAPAAEGSAAASLYPEGGNGEGGETTAAPAGESTPAASASEPAASGEASTPALSADAYTFTLPESLTADDALSSEAKTLFAEAGVAPDKAQGLIDLYAKALDSTVARANAEFQAQQTAWKAQIDAMPEFQGETRETSLQAIGRVFDEYGSPEVKELFNNPLIGNNPHLAKLLVSVANVLNEGAPARPGGPAATGRDGKPLNGRSIGQRLYPDLPN